MNSKTAMKLQRISTLEDILNINKITICIFTSAPSMFDLFGGSIFSFDFSVSESDWLPESEPLPESLLPDWLLLLEELELEPEPEPDAEADPEPDSSSELLSM